MFHPDQYPSYSNMFHPNRKKANLIRNSVVLIIHNIKKLCNLKMFKLTVKYSKSYDNINNILGKWQFKQFY